MTRQFSDCLRQSLTVGRAAKRGGSESEKADAASRLADERPDRRAQIDRRQMPTAACRGVGAGLVQNPRRAERQRANRRRRARLTAALGAVVVVGASMDQ